MVKRSVIGDVERERVQQALTSLAGAYSPGDLAADVAAAVGAPAESQMRLFDREGGSAPTV